MSLNPVPLKLFRAEDPVTRIDSKREYSVFKGGQEVSYFPFTTSGLPNQSTNTINCNPTSQYTIVDRKFLVLANFTLLFNNAGNSGAVGGLLQAGYDAPRAYPLSMCTQNVNVQLGDNSVSTNLNEYFSCLERYSANYDLENLNYGMTPSMPDQYADYATSAQQNNSELQGYSNNNVQVPRGFSSNTSGNAWYTITQGSTGSGATASVNLTVCEPLFLSPLLFGKDEHSGIIGIQNMTVQIQFGDLSRLWSHSSASPSTVLKPTVTCNSLQILIKQVTPDPLMRIPPIIAYPYNVITSYPAGNPVSLTSGQSMSFTSSSITLNSIPTRIYVYARIPNANLSFTSTDTFAILNNITVQLGTRQLLSSATQYDLYQMAVRNGCNQSWSQWSKYTGGPLAIDLGKDIGLMPTESAGLLTRNSLQITANFTNPSISTQNYIMYVLICEEGTCTIVNGHMQKAVGVLTQEDILSAEHAPEIPYRTERNFYGGSFLGDFWEGFKKPFKFIYDNKDDIISTAKAVAPFVGVGMSGGRKHRVKKHRNRRHKKGAAIDEEMQEYVHDSIEGGRRRRKRSRKHSKKGHGISGGRKHSKKHSKRKHSKRRHGGRMISRSQL
jgi:hypothetical protein